MFRLIVLDGWKSYIDDESSGVEIVEKQCVQGKGAVRGSHKQFVQARVAQIMEIMLQKLLSRPFLLLIMQWRIKWSRTASWCVVRLYTAYHVSCVSVQFACSRVKVATRDAK